MSGFKVKESGLSQKWDVRFYFGRVGPSFFLFPDKIFRLTKVISKVDADHVLVA
jgi:hypothetical protein